MLKKLRHTHRQQARQAHKNALRKDLEHRFSVAKTKGNDILIRQLQAEAQALHLDVDFI